jgi:hypothetical protein
MLLVINIYNNKPCPWCDIVLNVQAPAEDRTVLVFDQFLKHHMCTGILEELTMILLSGG